MRDHRARGAGGYVDRLGRGRPFAGRGSRVPSQVFVDEDGREVVLHGTNAVVKGPPWVPVADEFSADLSMTDADFAIMRDLGLTVVRLGVMWPGVEPSRGVYNETYLDIVADIVERAERHDVYVLMDMHQDVLADRFCGEGLPDWAVKTSGKWGPLPAPFPWPLGSAFRTEPRTGFPVRPDCAKHGWPDYYAAAETGQAFAALWTNRDGLLDAWAGMWAKVAERFKGNPAVLGLELMNEPFPGDVWSHPTELLPFRHRNGEALNMLPAYEALSAAIAAVDPDRLGEYTRPRGEGQRTDYEKKCSSPA